MAELTDNEIDALLAKFTPYKELFAYELAGQGWAVCWKGSKGEPIPVCHMRWTDGLRPEVEQRLEDECAFFAAAPAIVRQLREQNNTLREHFDGVVRQRNEWTSWAVATLTKAGAEKAQYIESRFRLRAAVAGLFDRLTAENKELREQLAAADALHLATVEKFYEEARQSSVELEAVENLQRQNSTLQERVAQQEREIERLREIVGLINQLDWCIGYELTEPNHRILDKAQDATRMYVNDEWLQLPSTTQGD